MGKINKIVLFGATGRLGNSITDVINSNSCYRLLTPTRNELNITDIEKLFLYLEDESPDLIINAAGMTSVQECQNNPMTMKVNRQAPRNMAMYCRDHNSKLIHISSNYVFSNLIEEVNTSTYIRLAELSIDGLRSNTNKFPYSVVYNPYSDYGWSKAYAEIDIQNCLDIESYRIVRIQNLFGGSGKNDTIPLRVLRESKTPPVTYCNIRVKPTQVAYTGSAICSLFNCDNGIIHWERDQCIEHIGPKQSVLEQVYVNSIMKVCGIECETRMVMNSLRPNVVLEPSIEVPDYETVLEELK